MHTSDETLADALARYAELVDTELHRLLDTRDGRGDASNLYSLVRYHLGWVDELAQPIAAPRGKGLRASLLLLVVEALGGDAITCAPLAAAVELLHNFSLLHDDIEDGSLTRRHRPTVWSLWGAPRGINAGDSLHALAHMALLNCPLRHTAPKRFIEVLDHFEQATLQLCEGQHLDMRFEDQPITHVSVDVYLRMIEGKSASLIAAAAWIGARAAGADKRRVEAAYACGYRLGMAFQMQDDILGIWGDEAVTGKSASTDITSRKKTLPILLAMAQGSGVVREGLGHLYARPHEDGDERDIRAIMYSLDDANARALSEDYLRRYRDDAYAALEAMDLPDEARDRLWSFAHLFVERTA